MVLQQGIETRKRENNLWIESNPFFKSNTNEIEILGALFRRPHCPCFEMAGPGGNHGTICMVMGKGENGQKRSGKPSHHFHSYKFLFGR
jgi:hypothetical protein